MSRPEAAPPLRTFPDGVIAIDTLTAGLREVTAGYLLDAPRPTLIECGPALTVETVLAGLATLGLDAGDLAHLVLTHIHLDHAGGAGDIAAAFPQATIVVSEHGARHLADPTRLNASSAQVYGPLFDTVYGACTPVPAERLRTIGDRGELDIGGGRVLELLHTPGHAKHHLGVVDPTIGAVFSGDSVGVKLPGMRSIRPATPPPEFHLDAALASLERYRSREPERIYLAHYGPTGPANEVLDEAGHQLRRWVEVAEGALSDATRRDLDREHALAHVAETLQRRCSDELAATEAPDGGSAQAIELLNDTRANAAGIVRYLERRRAGTLTPLG
jgi:glyoxylase-like metal-dependent hydrolase (beta-lactamase superfamily II)